MRLRLTARGVALLLAASALGIAAYGTQQQALLVPAALALAAVVGGIVLAATTRPSRRVSWRVPPLGTEGTDVDVAFALDPAFAHGSWYVPTSLQLTAERWERFGDRAAASLVLPEPRRGVHIVGPVVARRREGLGITVTTQTLGDVETVVVGPRVTPLHLDSVLGRGAEAALHGAGHGDVLDQAVRDYRTGDPIRRIHWRQSAKQQRLMVRSEQPPAEPRATVVLDTLAHGYANADEFDEAVRIFASLGAAILHEGLALDVVETGAPQLSAAASGGRSALVRACAGLERVKTPAAQHMTTHAFVVVGGTSEPARRVIARLRPGSEVWCAGPPPASVPRGVHVVHWNRGRPIGHGVLA